MKKQLIALALTGALCLGGLAACGGSTANTTNTASNTNNANVTNTTNTTNTTTNANKGTVSTKSSSDIAAVENELKQNLSTCYMGVGGDYKTGKAVDDFDTTYYMGFSSDASWGIVVAVDTEPDKDNGKYEYVDFVGPVTVNGDLYTIVDEYSGYSLTFSATAQSDGAWILDMGTEIGKAQVESCTSSDLVTALELIDQYGEPMD